MKTMLLSTVLLLAELTALANVIYVSPTGGGDKSGRDADNACAGLSAGYASASANDTIRLLGDSTYEVSSAISIAKDNLTFEGSPENPSRVVLDAGGRSTGFFSASKSVTFRGLTFRRSNATAASALAIAAGCSLMTVRDCHFLGCTNTTMGGALSCGMSTAMAVVSNCVFNSCASSANYGGALARSNGSLYVYDSNFTGCHSGATSRGGGAVYDANLVTGCTFTANTAAADGGACHLRDARGTIAGCTFTDCSSASGAAVVACDFEGTLVDCTFSNNVATSGKVTGCVGGTAATVIDCTFADNVTPKGGAIFNVPKIIGTDFLRNRATVSGGALYYSAALSSPCVVSNCTFVRNESATTGGVQSDMPNAAVSYAACVFEGNRAGTQGGVFYRASGTAASFIRCTFLENGAVQNGGALYGAKSVATCTFSNNVCGAKGSAVYTLDSGSLLRDSIFVGNLAATNGTETLGAGCVHATKATVVRQCLFVGNESESSVGGAALSWNNLPTTLTVENCTVAHNRGELSIRGQNANTGCTMTNCLFYGNASESGAKVNFADKMPMSGVYNAEPYGLGACAADVANAGFGDDNGFLLAASPFVADGTGVGREHDRGDCHLAKYAGAVKNPCVNAAVRLDWMTPAAVDLDGAFGLRKHPRVSGGAPDIGCYEYLFRSGMIMSFR